RELARTRPGCVLAVRRAALRQAPARAVPSAQAAAPELSVDVDTLREAVARTYAAGPLAGVSWPDPHPDHEVADEEYSRVTDPERYRVIGARTVAWIETLTNLGMAASTAVPVPAG